MESPKLTSLKNPITISMAVLILLLTTTPRTSAQTPSPTPTPAPAPAPEFVNLTDLLTVAGPFKTFLEYLISTKTIETLQNQANNTEEGVTIFVPKDSAFSSQKSPSLKNLTSDQLRQLMLFHALPHYYSFSDFTKLSLSSPVSTMAGGGLYALNFTDYAGTIRVDSGWTRTNISSSVHSSDPCAVYQVDRVLLPMAIFGTDVPAPAPEAPAPEAPSPGADAPAADADAGAKSPATSSPGKSGAAALGAAGHFVLAAAAAAAVAALL